MGGGISSVLSLLSYIACEEPDRYTYNEDSPEDVETLQNHQQAVEKVVAKERLINGHWINPCAVNNPRREEMED